MNSYWVSWWESHKSDGFTLDSPWWVTGERMGDGAQSICAAIRANDEQDARERVRRAHDAYPLVELEWRFVDAIPNGQSPFNDRFQRVPWMKWEATHATDK